MSSDTYSRAYDLYLASEMASEGDIKKLLIGENEKIFIHTREGWAISWRKVHNDYAAIFLGSGFIGLLTFLYIHLLILLKNYSSFRISRGNMKYLIMGTVSALLFATMVQSMANQYWNISSLSTSFFLLGVMTKYNKLTP